MGSESPYSGASHISPSLIHKRGGEESGNLFGVGYNITKGFLHENLIARGIQYASSSIMNNNKSWKRDEDYNVLEDEQLIGLEEFYGRFMHSRSKEHTTELVKQFIKHQKDFGNSPAFLIGRVLGGILDPSSLFVFTKAGRFLLTGSRLARGTKYGAVAGAEEMVGKRYFDHTRPMHESLLITAAVFTVPAIFPALKPAQATKVAKKFDKSADELDKADDAIFIKTKGMGADVVDKEKIIEKTINGEKNVFKIKNVKPVNIKYNTKKYATPDQDPNGGFWFRIENAKTGKEITVKAYRGRTSEINKEPFSGPVDFISGALDEGFELGGNFWTLSKGVASSYSDDVVEATLKFKNPVVINSSKEYYKFISKVVGEELGEKQVVGLSIMEKQSGEFSQRIAQYMKANKHDAIIINGKRNDIIKTLMDQNQIIVFGNPRKAVKETAKETFERESNEALNKIEPTFMGVFGERGPWNPIFRTFKDKIQPAQDFVENVLEIHLHQVKNKNGIITNASIERSIKMRYREVLGLHTNINTMYNTYLSRLGNNKQNWFEKLVNQKFIRATDEAGNKVLSPTQFHESIWKVAHNISDDTIPEEAVTAFNKFVKPFYDKIGKEYEQLKIIEHYLEGQLKYFDDILKKTKQFDKFKSQRKIIEDRLEFIKQYGALRKNYKTNIVWKAPHIQARLDEFKALLRKQLVDVPEETIDKIARKMSTYQPYIDFDRLTVKANQAVSKGKAEDIEDFISGINKISARFQSRDLNLDYEDFMKAGFIETDITVLTKMYFNQTIPDIEITKIFGDPMGLGQRYVEGGVFKKGIQQIRDDYEKIINKKKSTLSATQLNKLYKLRDEAIDDADASIGLVRGTAGLHSNPNRAFSRAIRMVKLYNAFTMLTGISQSMDLLRLVAIQGVTKTFRSSLEVMTSGMARDIVRKSKNTTQLGGEATDLATSSTAMRQYDIQDAFGVYNKFERGWSSLGNLYFTFINLSNPWNASVKTIAGMFNGTRLLEACEKIYLGKTLKRADQMRLSNLGISSQDAIKIWKQYEKHGIGKGGRTSWSKNNSEYKVLRLANTEEWEDELLADVFHRAIGKQASIDVVTPGKGDIPLWANEEIGGVLTQFKKFGMASTQRMLMRGLQERDSKQMQGFLLLLAGGMMLDAFRQRQFDRDYRKKPFAQKIIDGLDRSGLIGIYSDINNALERMTNNEIGLRPVLGSKKPYGTYRNVMKDPVRAGINMPLWDIAGPTASQLSNLADIAWTWGRGKYNHHTAKNVRRLIPLQNVWFFDSLFDKLEKNVLYKSKAKPYKRKTVRNTIFSEIYKGPKEEKELEVKLQDAKERIKTLKNMQITGEEISK